MSAVAYGPAVGPADVAPAGPSWRVRLVAALQESRRRQAAREIAYCRHLLPAEMEWAGNRISYENDDQLPFIR